MQYKLFSKNCTIILFLILISQNLFSQWKWSNPTLSGNTLKSIAVVPGQNKLFAVGTNGTLLKSDLSGNNPSLLNLNTERNLHSVFFTSANIGYVCGDNNTFFKTTNGGNTWNPLLNETYSHENSNYSLFFLNDNVGYMTGNKKKILKTINGGTTWDTLSYSTFQGYESNYSQIYFINNNLGFLYTTNAMYASFHYFLRTNNGGSSWDTLNIGPRRITGISFVNDSVGFISGSSEYTKGFLFKTSTKGNKWDTLKTPSNNVIENVYFQNKDTGLIFTSGYIFKTINGGLSWSSYNEPSYLKLFSVSKQNKDTIFACGESGLIMRTNNFGGTWLPLTNGNCGYLTDIMFTDDSNGYVIGNKLLKTTDAGKTWNKVNANNITPSPISTYFTSKDTGYITGYVGTLQKTNDGGNNWVNLISNTPYYLGDITFTTKLTGFAVGGYSDSIGVIVKTIDGGNTWISNAVADDFFLSVDFPSQKIGYAAGGYNSAIIYKTLDSGKVWNKLPFPDSSQINAVHFIDESVGFVSLHNKGIYKTKNGGQSWTFTNMYNSADIFFIDNNVGFLVSSLGSIYKTLDQGETWFMQPSPTVNSLTGVYFTGAQKGFICGNFGTILYSDNKGKKCNPVKFSVTDTVFCPNKVINFKSWDLESDKYIWKKNGVQFSTDIYSSTFFESQGTNTITLIESNPECKDSISVPITINKESLANFEFDKLNDSTIQFKHIDSISAVKWVWDFGDSTFSSSSNPTHKYSKSGYFYVTLSVTSKGGCKSYSVNSINISGLDEQKPPVSMVEIYPNPFDKEFILQFETKNLSQVRIEIFDISGNKIFHTLFKPDAPGKYQMELSKYFTLNKSGIYFLKLLQDDAVLGRKIIHLNNTK